MPMSEPGMVRAGAEHPGEDPSEAASRTPEEVREWAGGTVDLDG